MKLVDGQFNPISTWPLLEKLTIFLQEYTELEPAPIEFERPDSTLIIAISPRVGSTALVSALSKAGLAKEIGEWINPRGPFDYEYRRSPASSLNHYMSNVVRHYTYNGLLVFKTAWQDFFPFVENNLVEEFFPNRSFVFIDRLNKAAQAVSLYRAVESGHWHTKVTEEKKSYGQVKFNLSQLMQHYNNIIQSNEEWENYFRENNCDVLRITYESFEQDIAYGVKQIFQSLGLEQPETFQTAYQKTADEVSEQWTKELEQYLLEHQKKE